MVTIKKLLRNVNVCQIEGSINENTLTHPILTDAESYEGALLYIISKTGTQELDIDCSKFTSLPYAIVTSETQKMLNCHVPIIRVDSPRFAFSHACSNMYDIDYKRMKIIGITGSNGKTTTATLIHQILSDAGYRTGFIGTGKISIGKNIESSDKYSMTTPDPTLLYSALSKMQDAKCEYVVMEVSSHSIALEKISPIEFEYAIFTNLSAEHLDFHKSMDAYFSTKLKLFSKTNSALFNLDDKYSSMAYESVDCKKTAIGIIHSAPVYATEIDMRGFEGTSFFYRENDLICKVETRLPGAFNIYNVMMALRCTKDLGVKLCISKRSIERISCISGRMQAYHSDITALIDYAHTPFALYNCLNFLFSVKKRKQKLIVVFGCGGNRDKSKRAPMGRIASSYADMIIITSDNNRTEPFADIASDIEDGISDTPYNIIENREEAISSAIINASPGDIVAIIGKGCEQYINSGDKMLCSCDYDLVKNAMNKRELYYESKVRYTD